MSRLLASFPNSRIKPRPATRVSVTSELAVPAFPATVSIPANENRTIMQLFNSGANPIRYQYATAVNIDTQGFLLPSQGAINIESPEEVFLTGDGGASTLSVDEGEG